MIKVMIAEDNVDLNSKYCEFLTKDKEIEVVSRTVDGKTTISSYLALKPDLLLLDLDFPDITGLEVINSLSTSTYEKGKCNIIVISGNANLMHTLYNTSKVYKIIPKPVEFNQILNVIEEFSICQKAIPQKALKSLLIDLKFNLYSYGTLYLIDAINIAYKNPQLLCNISDLYKQVAIYHNQKCNKIQRSIRSSIETMNKHIPQDVLHSFFHVTTNELIAPKYFFTMIIEYFSE